MTRLKKKKLGAGGMFDNSYLDNSLVLIPQCKNRSFNL